MNPRLAASRPIIIAILSIAATGAVGNLPAQSPTEGTDSVQDTIPLIGHGDKGFEFRTRDGNYLLQIQARVQIRYATPQDADPVTFDDFDEPSQQIIKVNRARLKIGGHGYRPWLKYYFEYELAAGNLLDFRVSLEQWPALQFRAGQYKAQYNRERVISSGAQQLADRSIINRAFTLDRQQGLSLYGRLRSRGAADVSYWASVFMGTGRGAGTNDDNHLMWMGRVQWNFLGRVVEFNGSDIPAHEKPEGILALAAVTNQSRFTRFSQSGGGELEGFEPGQPGQYRVNQWMEETAFKHRGFSWQQEFHWKRIKDTVNGTVTTLIGNYAQLGYFFHEAIPAVPAPLELAFRQAVYDPNTAQTDDLHLEFSFAANWFFHGHLNKLTTELSWFVFEESTAITEDELRLRVQWDVSF